MPCQSGEAMWVELALASAIPVQVLQWQQECFQAEGAEETVHEQEEHVKRYRRTPHNVARGSSHCVALETFKTYYLSLRVTFHYLKKYPPLKSSWLWGLFVRQVPATLFFKWGAYSTASAENWQRNSHGHAWDNNPFFSGICNFVIAYSLPGEVWRDSAWGTKLLE